MYQTRPFGHVYRNFYSYFKIKEKGSCGKNASGHDTIVKTTLELKEVGSFFIYFYLHLMKKNKLFIGFIFVALIYFGCKPSEIENKTLTEVAPTQKQMVIYGSSECDHCIEFISKMDSMGLMYEFKDVNGNQILTQELYAKIKEFNFTEYINLPVVIIDNTHFLVGPNPDTIPSIMK